MWFATADAQQLLTRVLPWMGALVGGLILLVAGVGFCRRRTRRADDQPGPAWTLQDLRDLHTRGGLSDAEYQRIKGRLLGGTGAPARGGTEGRSGETDHRPSPS